MDANFDLDQDLINAVAAITEASCAAKKMEKEELHPNQKVLDKNGNGKLDADDFKKLRKEETVEEGMEEFAKAQAKKRAEDRKAKEKMSEEAELDESLAGQAKHLVKGIKRAVAGKPSAAASEKDADTKARQRYSDSKVHSRAAADAAFDFKSPNKRVYANRLSAANYNIKKGDHQSRRADKIAALRDKVRNEDVYLEDYTLEEIQDFMMTEDFEQLDELSKNTLGSYVRKAATSLSKASQDLGDKRAQSAEVDRFTNRHMPDKFNAQDKMKDHLGVGHKAQEKDLKTVLNRHAGIRLAANKLTKEQVEEIEMLAAKHGLGE